MVTSNSSLQVKLPHQEEDNNCNSGSGSDSDWDDTDSENDEKSEIDPNLIFYPICSNCVSSDVDTDGNPTPMFQSLKEALDYDVTIHEFDLLQYLPSSQDDDFLEKTIICINKCRSFVSQHYSNMNHQSHLSTDTDSTKKMNIGQLLKEYLDTTTINDAKSGYENDDDDVYFKPVLQDDAFLMCMDDLEDLKEIRERQERNQNLTQNSSLCMYENQQQQQELTTETETNQDNVNSKNQIFSKTNQESQIFIQSQQIQMLEEQLRNAKAYIQSLLTQDETSLASPSTITTSHPPQDNDTYYFQSYSHSSIHETMLRDTIRTNAYQDAILSSSSNYTHDSNNNNNNNLFYNKIVLDIGCGTGILSLFAAKAGAKQVIGIDASDVYKQAIANVHENGYEDVITIVHGKVEDLIQRKMLPLEYDSERKEYVKCVDVIISEWMGYALFFETMLPSVLYARDVLMKPKDGSMYPNRCKMYIEGCKDERLDYWNNVYGFRMNAMRKMVRDELLSEAVVESVKKEDITTDRFELKEWDLNCCSDDDLDFCALFELNQQAQVQGREGEEGEDGSDALVRVDKLVVSFDVDFDIGGYDKTIILKTGCQSGPTHWKQTTLWLHNIHNPPHDHDNDNEKNESNVVMMGKKDVLRGKFSMKRNNINHRDMDFKVDWEVVGMDDDKVHFKGTIQSKLTA